MNKIKEEIKDKYDVVKKKSKLLLHKAKIKYPKIFDSRYNKSFVIVSFIVFLGLITTASYATFVFLTSDYRAADIRFANLMYSMKIDDESTRTVTVNANSVTTYDIDLDALNEITSKYLVYYTSSNTLTNVKVEYSNLSTGRGEGNIGPTASRRIRIVVTNDSSSAVTLNFSVKGGYVYNNLSLGSGEYKIDGIFDEKSEASGDIVLRTYLNGKMVEEMPNYADMQANNYVYDETASACSNGAQISYTPTSTTAKLEITNVSGPTECAAVFHSRSDLTVTFIADNLLVNEAPTKESGYTVESATCNNNATISWDTTNWKANVGNVTQTNTNCVVRFFKDDTIIPVGATYEMSDGTVLNAGSKFPEQPTPGDVYYEGDYKYTYKTDPSPTYWYDWSVLVRDKTKTSYANPRSEVAGLEVNDFSSAYQDCTNLIKAPVIPDTAYKMEFAFSGCTSLTTVQNIPNQVEDLTNTFANCTSLKSVPKIPDTAYYMSHTFYNCKALTGEIIIDASPFEYNYCFNNTTQPISLSGNSTNLSDLAATANNGNVTVK